MTDTNDDTIDRLRRHMDLSRTIGAPIERIPAKSVELANLVLPWLTRNTTPREAGVVIATVYLYISAMVMGIGGIYSDSDTDDGDDDSDSTQMTRAKELLDIAEYIVAIAADSTDDTDD